MSEHLCGLYRGIVTNITDPDGRYRIRAKVATVLGEQECNWALPCVLPGWPTPFPVHSTHATHTFNDAGDGTENLTHDGHTAHTATKITPAVDDVVWIMFEGGDIDTPVWMGTWKING